MEGVALRNPTPINWAGRWYIIGGDPSDLNSSLVYHAEGTHYNLVCAILSALRQICWGRGGSTR